MSYKRNKFGLFKCPTFTCTTFTHTHTTPEGPHMETPATFSVTSERRRCLKTIQCEMDKKQRAALYNQDTMRSELKVSNRNALCKSQIAKYTVQNRKNEI